jgi:hypothetical protein
MCNATWVMRDRVITASDEGAVLAEAKRPRRSGPQQHARGRGEPRTGRFFDRTPPRS